MATATRTTSKQQAGGRTKSLISRTLDRCRSAGASPVAGCFSVYVGPERERFVVRAECANHPLLRRLLDDAEREYGYAAQGPIALPGCHVDAFHDVLWHMEHDAAVDDDSPATAASSPICGLRTSGGSFNKGRAAGYRMLSPRSSPQVGSRKRS